MDSGFRILCSHSYKNHANYQHLVKADVTSTLGDGM